MSINLDNPRAPRGYGLWQLLEYSVEYESPKTTFVAVGVMVSRSWEIRAFEPVSPPLPNGPVHVLPALYLDDVLSFECGVLFRP